MAKLNIPKAGGGDFVPQQPIRLKRGVYGAVLQRYSEYQGTKFVKGGGVGEPEDKVNFGFVVMFDAADRPLPTNTRAGKQVAKKVFYNATTDIRSGLTDVLAALLDGKMTMTEIAENPDAVPDFDTLVGHPVSLQIEPAPKADKHGIFHNNVKAIYAASDSLKQVVRGIYSTFEFKFDEKDGKQGNRYLASPKPEYEESATPAATGTGQASANTATAEAEEYEIPF